jgi:hypothetical protein
MAIASLLTTRDPSTVRESILPFLFLWQACKLKNFVLASPSAKNSRQDLYLAIVLASDVKAEGSWF